LRTNYKAKNLKQLYRINNQIFAKTMRLIDDEGKQIDVVTKDQAVALAQEKELDLVEIAPNANPPVVKLIDYNKFLYQLKKKKQEEKRKTIVSVTKEVRMGPFIDKHDLDVKLKKAKDFLSAGNKVRFVVKFKGRQLAKMDLGGLLLKNIAEDLKETAKVERDVQKEGRQMTMLVTRLK